MDIEFDSDHFVNFSSAMLLLLFKNPCESLKHETDDDPKGLSVVKMCHPPALLPPTC